MKPPTVDKEIAKRRLALNGHCNRILSQFSFKQIKVWNDVYKFTSVPINSTPKQLSTPVDIKGLREYLQSLKDNFEKSVVATAAKLEPVVPTNGVQHPTMVTQPELIIAPVLEPAILPPTLQPEDLSINNDYGCKKSPNEKAFFYWFQKKAITETMNGILVERKQSQCILSPTGSGKTYICGGVIRRLVDMNYHTGKTFGVVNYLYVTRATIVEQTKRVFRDTFGLGIKDAVEVLNIEQLRSRAGQAWVNEKCRIVNGEEEYYWEWKKGLAPCVIIWDECQALKNSTSTQHKIAAALNDIPGIIQLHVSATPFTRVSEAKCFAVSTGKDITNLLGMPSSLTNATWPTYSYYVAQGDPTEYNEAAVERLVKDLDEFIVRVKGIRPQFDAINRVEMILFQTPEERAYYAKAWERYLEEKAKIDEQKMKDGEATSGISQLVAFLKFRMAAEFCRAAYLARRMYETVMKDGKAAVCALNFKGTIIEVVKILVEVYGVPRNKISLVWGGGQTQLTKKQKAKASILDKAEDLKKAGLDADALLEDLELDKVEERQLQDLPEHLRLGAQSKEERQKEIDRFQSGRSEYCLFTFRAGGVGLSLHHTDEMSPFKVRHKESGYAIEEDICKVPIKPRRLFAAPTYSAIEIVQGLGRCPRLTSLSDTEQFLVFYRETIEEDVADIVSQKLRCLSKVVKTREKWSDIVIDGRDKKLAHLNNVIPDSPDDGNPLEGQSTTEEEE